MSAPAPPKGLSGYPADKVRLYYRIEHGPEGRRVEVLPWSPLGITRRDEAFVAYHSDPAYLAMVRSTFGEPVVRHIEKMLDIPVKRRLLETS